MDVNGWNANDLGRIWIPGFYWMESKSGIDVTRNEASKIRRGLFENFVFLCQADLASVYMY